jgi:hypothetical protein
MQTQRPRVRFKPVELQARHDGWTPARQFRFIEVLAATRSITRACAAVGMSRESAYSLLERSRTNPQHRGFALAWSAALKPDFAKGRPRSPRAALRMRRLNSKPAPAGPKVDEMEELHGPPDSLRTVNQDRQLRQLWQLVRAGWE